MYFRKEAVLSVLWHLQTIYTMTKKTIPSLLSAVFLYTLAVGCTEDLPDASDVALFVTPRKDTTIVLNSGDKMRYQLQVYTTHDYLLKVGVKSFDSYAGYAILLDSTYSKRMAQTDHYFVYTAPEIDREELEVELTFTAEDNDGHLAEVTRMLKVKNKLIVLNERSGVVLYAPASGNPDALSFDDVSQPFILSESSDSLNADIYLTSNDDFTSIEWRSKTHTRFVRNNSFNYTTATATRINQVYQSSVRTDFVDNIRINDIILVGHGNTAEGVFHVKNIIQPSGLGNDACIQLGYKGIVTPITQDKDSTSVN